jgi:hypothetical protein
MNQGCTNPGLPIHIKTCNSSHAPSRKGQMTVRFTGHARVVGLSVQDLRYVTILAPRFFEMVSTFFKKL